MQSVTIEPRRFPHDPLQRGYNVMYRLDEVNHCPGCSRSHWYVGRYSAECGFCGTAVPLDEARTQSAGGGHSRIRHRDPGIAWAA